MIIRRAIQGLTFVWEALPQGEGLSEEVWRIRHRAFILLLWLHALGFPFVAAIFGHTLTECLFAGAVIACFALLAGSGRGSRKAQAAVVSLGLASSSGMLVHLSGGYIEMHFHYFVMVTFLVLYQDWVPFLIFFAFVGLQHGIMGVLVPHSVYNHPDAFTHPWKWAGIHAMFIGAASVGCILAWKNIEQGVQALRQAHDDLELHVQERTADLVEANQALHAQVAERLRVETALRVSEERFRLIMEHANDAIFFLDLNGVVKWANHHAAILTGRPMSELAGQPVVAFLAPGSAKLAETRLAAVRRGETVQPIVEMEIIRPTGDSMWLELNAISVAISQFSAGRLIVARDITERKLTENALRESEQQMRLFMLATNDSTWNWDMAARSVTRSGFERAFGYSAEEVVPSIEWWEERLHPDDRERVLSTFQDAVARGSITCSYEYRFRRRDGSYAVISDRAYIVRDRTGNPVRTLGTMTDITERKRAEAALRESGQRLNHLLDDRERISRDLHDNIIQMLYAIGLGLEESQRLIGEDSKSAAQNVSNAVKELNAVIRDVRSYIAWSEPKISDGRQLKAAIERLARTMDGTHLLHFRLKVDQEAADKLTPEEAGHVLYIAREAMSNSLRHSQARDGTVVLEARDGNICLVVADAGEGFDTTDTGRYGQGLRNMAARAQKLDARLQIVSEPGLGVRIMLDIPMVKKRASAGV